MLSITLVVGTMFLLNGCDSPEEKQKSIIKKSLIYANLGKFKKAEETLKTALKKYPKSRDIHLSLGNIYARQKKFDSALEEFKKTLELDPDYYETNLQISKVLYDQEDYSSALMHVDKAIALKADYVGAYDFKGTIHMKIGQYEEAAKDYQKIIDLQPKKPDGYLRLANIYLIQKNFDKTKELCETILKDIDKNNLQALLLLSLILEINDKIDEAITLLSDSLKEKPNNLQIINRLSELYLKKGDYDNAMAYAEKALSINSNAAAARYVKGTVYFIREEYEKASIQFENFFEPPPNYGDVFYKLGLCYLELDKPQQGISELKKMIERYPRYVPAYFTLAYAYMREGWSDEAIALCQKGLELSPNNVKGLEILAKANITTKNFNEAERAYENLIKARPGRVADLLSLASLKINKGEIDEAYEICNEVLKINSKNVNAHSLKGFCYIRQGNIDKAIEQFRQVIQIDPLNISGHLNLAKIYSSVSRFKEAEEELLNLIELKPDYKEVQKELGNLYFVQGKYDKAIEFFTKILNENPHDLHTNLSLAGTYFAKEDYEQALNILEPFRKNPKFDDNLKLHSFLATIYFKLNDNEEAEKEYKKVLAIDPHFRPAYDLGLVYMDQGKASESIEVYKQALKINPELTEMILHLSIAQQKNGMYDEALESIMKIINLEQQNYSLYFIQINILAAKGDYEKAEEILSQIPEITDEVRDSYTNVIDMCRKDKESGRKLAYMLNQMKIYRSRGWINQAVELAEEVNKMVPKNVLPLAFLAEVYNDEKDYENMKKMLDKILVVDPESFIGNLRTSRYYSMNNNYGEAINYLKNAVTAKPDNATLLLDLGILYEKNNDIDNAIITYKKVLEMSPERYRAMNNLAWILSEFKKDYVQAESYSRQALDLAPKNGAVADTYGWILFQKGDYAKAKEILELAQKYLPSNSSVAYHLGKTYLVLEEKENARISLQKALDISPDFPESDEVKKLLKELSE